MRKLISILLLGFCFLPVVSPLLAFGADKDAGVPACCRIHGKHRCVMGLAERRLLAQHEPTFATLPEQCPYLPATAIVAHTNVLAPPPAMAIFARWVSHPACIAQTESKRRISQDRSRQKRGPPTHLLS
ncbi:MAG TPA: hypothetical protein VHU44_14225 [Acidobacteriaceae bacterium]|nr:hypothetical protein [Acidobacteriaceae bacterium]